MGSAATQDVDVLILGAGLSGLCSLYHIRKHFPDWRVRVLEAGPGVGGTWLHNRYPGARVDTESLSYGFSFDKELLQEWDWKDEFSTQAEMLRYIERVAEKNDLVRDVQFDTRVEVARWDDADRTWTLTDRKGDQYRTRFLVSCIGFLSTPSSPAIPGLKSFRGQAYHTADWPRDFDLRRDLAGKRVGVIGTGATGIQTITAISKEPAVESLTVFQRTANWAAPLRNQPISPEQMARYKTEYDAVFARCDDAPAGFLHRADPRRSLDVSPEERTALWEKLYSAPGFGKWMGPFADTYTDAEANRMYSDFMAAKIRARVHDPAVAAKLVPTDHGFGTRRVPLESGYFEAFNQPNVHLVDLKAAPIERFTADGLVTSDGREHPLDVVVFATGFNAIIGAFAQIEWHGRDGRPLVGAGKSASAAIWPDHRPRTFLGLLVPSLPNVFVLLGPHQPFGNAPRSIEFAAGVVCGLLAHCKKEGHTYVEPTEAAVDAWTDHVVACSQGQLGSEVSSWLTGVNTNVEGRSVRTVVRYSGSYQQYRGKCNDCAAGGWKELSFA